MNPKIRRLPIMRQGSVEVTDTLDEILNQNVSVSGSSAEIFRKNRITVIFRLLLKIDDKQGRTIRKSRSDFFAASSFIDGRSLII